MQTLEKIKKTIFLLFGRLERFLSLEESFVTYLVQKNTPSCICVFTMINPVIYIGSICYKRLILTVGQSDEENQIL